jgi:hypothetical protein
MGTKAHVLRYERPVSRLLGDVLLHLVKTWPSMDPRMHLDSSSLATFSFGLLVFLLKERASGWSMMMAAFAFIAAVNLALHMF